MAFRHRRESYVDDPSVERAAATSAASSGRVKGASSGGGLLSSLALAKAMVTALPPGAIGPSTQRLADKVLSRTEQQKMYGCFCRYASGGGGGGAGGQAAGQAAALPPSSRGKARGTSTSSSSSAARRYDAASHRIPTAAFLELVCGQKQRGLQQRGPNGLQWGLLELCAGAEGGGGGEEEEEEEEEGDGDGDGGSGAVSAIAAAGGGLTFGQFLRSTCRFALLGRDDVLRLAFNCALDPSRSGSFRLGDLQAWVREAHGARPGKNVRLALESLGQAAAVAGQLEGQRTALREQQARERNARAAGSTAAHSSGGFQGAPAEWETARVGGFASSYISFARFQEMDRTHPQVRVPCLRH